MKSDFNVAKREDNRKITLWHHLGENKHIFYLNTSIKLYKHKTNFIIIGSTKEKEEKTIGRILKKNKRMSLFLEL